jgi:hypothetical protein
MNLTFSVIGASLLAQPCIDERFPARRGARVEHVAVEGLIETVQKPWHWPGRLNRLDQPVKHIALGTAVGQPLRAPPPRRPLRASTRDQRYTAPQASALAREGQPLADAIAARPPQPVKTALTEKERAWLSVP